MAASPHRPCIATGIVVESGIWVSSGIQAATANSSTNSVKRLNNDAAAKAEVWIKEFGTATVIPAAVLSGVFKIHNLENAQTRGLTLFWAHRLDAMIDFIESTRP